MTFDTHDKSGEKLMKNKILGSSLPVCRQVGRYLTLGIAITVSLTSLAQQPTNYDVDLSGLGYGNISQTNPGIINGAKACVPTATINSFFFLQNYYGISSLGPGNGLLTQANATNAVNELGADMSLGGGGVTDANFITGKQQYLNNHGLSNMVSLEYEAVDVGQRVTPTWRFIYNQLMATQDVEIAFGWYGTSEGHCVTVTSFDFKDNSGLGIIDAADPATLDFTDPWDGQHYVGTLTMTNNFLKLTYVGGGAGDGAWGLIDIAVAESPIPEPATFSLLIIGGLAGFRVLWRKRS
jgi:hypothetical protein